MHKPKPVAVKVRIASIPDNGFHLVQEVLSEIFKLNETDRIACNSPLHVDLMVKIIGSDSILVTGSLKTEISSTCDRCLSDFSEEIEVSDVCQYYEDFDEEIDLTDRIREDILIAFPQNLLCSEKCEGLCIQCGANLNKTECTCEEPDFEEEEDEDSGSPWDALDNLNLD